MGLAAQVAQLQHIAQQSKAALAGKLLEHGQSGLHAVGVGVVAVLNDSHTLAVHHLLAAAGLLKGGQALDHLAGIAAQTGGGAVGRQRIGHIVLAHSRDLDHKSAFLLILQHKAHAVLLLSDGQCAHIGALIGHAEPHRPHMGGQLCRPQELVVVVQHQRGTLRQAVADLQLGLADVLLTAQIADVGHADAGDDAHIRAGSAGQTVDLASVAHAHLDHSVFGGSADAHQGAGHAQLVVLVALGLDGLTKAAQGRVGHLLGGGLAHAAGHAHHLGVILAAVVGTHHHHGVVAVRAEDGFFGRDALHRVVHHHKDCALFQCFGRKVVAVEPLAGKGHKDAARPHLTAVGGDQLHFRVAGEEAGRHKPCQQLACMDLFHSSFPSRFSGSFIHR